MTPTSLPSMTSSRSRASRSRGLVEPPAADPLQWLSQEMELAVAQIQRLDPGPLGAAMAGQGGGLGRGTSSHPGSLGAVGACQG